VVLTSLLLLNRTKITLKEAIDFISQAWDAVSEKTVVNCWKKTGIIPDSHDVRIGANEQEVQEVVIDNSSLLDMFDILSQSDTNVQLLVSNVDNYMKELDSPIPTEECMTDDEIIAFVSSQEQTQTLEDSDEEVPVISTADGFKGLSLFIQWFEQQPSHVDFKTDDLNRFRKYVPLMYAEMVKRKQQSTIDHFFL
jgi:hypothetical protein